MYTDSKTPAATQNSTIWAGCDVAKETFEVSLATSESAKDFPCRSFAMTEEGVGAFLKWADKQLASRRLTANVRVVMEATGRYSITLANLMLSMRPELSPAIINPQIAKSFIDSLGIRNKTDQTDARGLACFGQQRQPAAYEPPTKEYADLKGLVRTRKKLMAMRIELENIFNETPEDSPSYGLLKKAVSDLQKSEEKVLATIEKLVSENKNLRDDVALVDQIYGVGFVVAVTVLGELGDLRRFATSRKVTSFAGVTPQRHESGTSVHKRSSFSKKGNSEVRAVLYMASLSIINADNDLSVVYKRLVAAGKAKATALGAVMRKLLVLMHAVIVSGQPYEKHYCKT